ncbi:4Fe-4S dicluster domain-containing protein [Campylobacter geochelonis]|uniref:4Fe-4S dicluster domain-containing protein n=1 Tax=Campylobacter geochelonis TaxID=1780362 RepID=UPI000770A109|nr:4Fe-4S dicluster domain-containing protein [Campylobacter geochelonis]CZE46523.1 methyl-accepting chemotaxis sensory transducer [Campylobacter geochelonis]
MQEISQDKRREFIKKCGLLFASTVSLQASPNVFTNSKTPRYGMVIDLSRCVGCQSCTASCSMENDVPIAQFRTIVSEYEAKDDKGNGVIASLPRLCNHCQKPACIDVCPTGASYQRQNGIVKVDTQACISCALCVEACPYHARFLNKENLTADKCTLCDHRLRDGLLPACVESCVGASRIVGDLHDENSQIRKFLQTHKTMVLYSPKDTNPRVFYHGISQILAKNEESQEYKRVIHWSEELYVF